MTGREIIELAKYSELAQLSVKDKDEALLSYLNLGLVELHKRFPLVVEEYVLALVDGQSIYTMPSDFMYLIAAYGEVDKNSQEVVNPLPINEEDNIMSVNTVTWNKVQVPLVTGGAYISLIYVANPTLLTISDLDNEVDLPLQMINALLSYIGYRGHAALDGTTATENNVHYMRFVAHCDEIDKLGLFTRDDMYMNSRIETRGFV